MSSLDALLERSNNPGSAVERHRFTLARDKAVEKMRDSALRDPRRAFVEVMAGAQLTGADYLGVNTDDEQILIAWVGGTDITALELENLFDYLFADQTNRQTRHLQQLAVGINGLLNGQASSIRIEVGDGTLEGSVRVDLAADGSAVLLDPTTPLDGGYVAATRPWSLRSYFRNSPALLEKGIIEELFQYTTVPILLNGDAPFGVQRNATPFLTGPSATVVRTENFTAQLHVHRGHGAGTLVPVIGGARVAPVPIGELLGDDLRVVAIHNGLRKTADMAEIALDAQWWRMLHELRPHADALRKAIRGPDVDIPPPLPPIPAEDVATDETERVEAANTPLEPLFELLPSLTPRRSWRVQDLAQLPTTMPILWALPRDVDLLGADADPAVAPWPMLELPSGQARALRAALPSHSVTRVGSAADLRYLRTVASRAASMAEATVSLQHLGIGGSLTVRLHQGTCGPCWEPTTLGLVPTAIVVDGRTRSLGYMPLRIDNISVVVSLKTLTPTAYASLWQDSGTTPERRLSAMLVDATLSAVWKIVEREHFRPEEPSHVHFVTSVLANHLEAQFVQTESGTQVAVTLPVRSGRAASRLLDFPLAQAGGETLTAHHLAELATQCRSVRLDLPSSPSLRQIADGFAPGALLEPFDTVSSAAVLHYNGHVWGRLYHKHLPADSQSLILLKTHAEPTPLPTSKLFSATTWERIATPSPFVEVLHNKQYALRPDALASGLQRAATIGASLSPSPTLPLVRMTLAAMLNDPVVAPLTTADRHPISAAEPHLRVVALGGPHVQSRTVVELSWHELQALQVLRSQRRLPPAELLHDDPPETWHQLLEEPGWLLRVKVDLPAYSGCLGFRLPFDPTGGLLVETPSGRISADLSVPCHGVVWTTADASGSRLPPELLDALEIRSLELLRQLAELLATNDDKTLHDTAEAYARTLAEAGWSSPQGPSAIQRRLADLIQAGNSTLADQLDRNKGPHFPRVAAAGNTTLNRPESHNLSSTQLRGLRTPIERLEAHMEAAVSAAIGQSCRITLYHAKKATSPFPGLFGQRNTATRTQITLRLHDMLTPSLERALQMPQLSQRRTDTFDALCYVVLHQLWQVANARGRPFSFLKAQEALTSELLTYEAR